MRIALRHAGALILILGAAYAGPSAGGRGPASGPTRQGVVFLGDSITSGDGVTPDVTFADRPGDRARGAGLERRDLGDTTTGGLQRLDADVLSRRPRVVGVELGVNDEVDHHRPAAETLATLQRITRRLVKQGVAVVLLYTPFREFGHPRYREGLHDLVRRERVRLVEDFDDGIVPRLTVDGLHPSAEGHALLAKRLEPVLRELLAR